METTADESPHQDDARRLADILASDLTADTSAVRMRVYRPLVFSTLNISCCVGHASGSLVLLVFLASRLFLESGQRIHQQSGWVGSPDVAEPVTNVGVHQSFAVSILSISTAAIKTG
jgi:hypothetical protein